MINKYGRDNFKKEILFFCKDAETKFSLEPILISEVIKNPLCMNIAPGGNGGNIRGSGWNHTEEAIEKIKKARANQKSLLGIKRSDEAKQNISKGRLGMKFSAEHCENIRQSCIGRSPSEEARKKNSIAHTGMKRSEETRAKMRRSKIGNTNAKKNEVLP